jgi:hypothetical protein
MADLDKLEELAKAANNLVPYTGDVWFKQQDLTREGQSGMDPADAAFIAAANPATVLELIALARRDGVEERVNSGHGSVYDRLLTFIHDRDDALRGDEGTSPDEIDETVLAIMRITGSHAAPTAPSTAEDASMAGGEDGDVEWPESPLANALFDHVQSQFSLDRDEAAEEAGEILQILADHGVDPTKLPAALRQPDTAAVTADAVRNTITRFLTADDPTHWGEFERRLAVAVGMTPSTAEDASMAGGETMFGVTGAYNEVEALACALWAERCPGFVMQDEDRPYYEAAAKAALDALDGELAPADPRPDPLEALREAREALVYYSKAEAYGRRIILNVEVMYDRGKKARQALANIKAVMGEAM